MTRLRSVLYGPKTIAAGAGLPLANFGFSMLVTVALVLPLESSSWAWKGQTVQSISFAFGLVPACLVGLAVGTRQRPWQAVSTVAIWSMLSATGLAWLYTDPVQGGVQMSPEWVRAEFLEILRGFLLLNSLPSIPVLVAAWAVTRRVAAHRACDTPA